MQNKKIKVNQFVLKRRKTMGFTWNSRTASWNLELTRQHKNFDGFEKPRRRTGFQQASFQEFQ